MAWGPLTAARGNQRIGAATWGEERTPHGFSCAFYPRRCFWVQGTGLCLSTCWISSKTSSSEAHWAHESGTAVGFNLSTCAKGFRKRHSMEDCFNVSFFSVPCSHASHSPHVACLVASNQNPLNQLVGVFPHAPLRVGRRRPVLPWVEQSPASAAVQARLGPMVQGQGHSCRCDFSCQAR